MFLDGSKRLTTISQTNLTCLDTFCGVFGAIVSPHKIDFWLFGLDLPLEWIPTAWFILSWGDCQITRHPFLDWVITCGHVELVSLEVEERVAYLTS